MSRITCESLEIRRLLATFQVDGTSSNDTITLTINGASIVATVNGNQSSALDLLNDSVEINGLGGNDTISINQTGSNTVTVNGGNGNDVINIANSTHILDFIDDVLTLNGDGGTDSINLFDDSAPYANDFTLNGTSVVPEITPAMFVSAENLLINSSDRSTTFIVNHVPATNVTLIGNTALGTDDRVHVVGTTGDSLDYGPDGTTNGRGTLVFESRTINYETLEHLASISVPALSLTTPNPEDDIFVASFGADDVTLTGTSGSISLTPLEIQSFGTLTLNLSTNDGVGGADDSIRLSGSVSNSSNIRIDAGVGNNLLTVTSSYGSVDTSLGSALGGNTEVLVSNSSLTFATPQTLKNLRLQSSFIGFGGSGTVLTTAGLIVEVGTGSLNLLTGQVGTVTGSFSIPGGRILNKFSGGTLNINGPQICGSNAQLNVEVGVCNINTDSGVSFARSLKVFVDNGATVNFGASQHIASLSCNGIANMLANGSRVLFTDSLVTAVPNGRLNLNDNDLIIEYTGVSPLPSILTKLVSGRNNGFWNGTGITSSTATTAPKNTVLGVLEGFEYDGVAGVGALFAGHSVDSTSLLIKYTYYGDTDLNGSVDFDDYVRIDQGFNQTRSGWLNGDFDLNGSVDFDDYVLIDLAFNTQGVVL